MKTRLTKRESMSRGFTLVELMVAMVIALIITIGVVQIFTANRATYQLDEGLARAQENGRFAIEFLAQDIRHAGYLGCNRDVVRMGPSQIHVNKPSNFLVGDQTYPIQGIRGFEYTATATGIGNTYPAGTFPINDTTAGWAPALDASVVPAPGAQPGSDVLVVERMIPNSWKLVAPFVDENFVYLDPAFVNQVQANDILVVSDCKSSAVFQATGVTPAGVISHATGVGTPGNRCEQWLNGAFATSNAVGAHCDTALDIVDGSATVGTFQAVAFYVAQGPGPCGPPGTCQPTLYRNLKGPGGLDNVQPLVEGVESFQVLYGVDDLLSDGIADRYVTANDVTDFYLVVSVRIGLLVHGTNATGSSNDIALDKDTHNVAGTIIDPADDKLRRRVFTTTLQLRNRGF
jgi:type IV pilus assembly protein PilW